jgi:hypothetical protein
MLLPVSPDIFDRIEFRRVGGEPFQRDATQLIRHEFLDPSATVSREPIPNDEKIAREVAHQVAQEFHHLRAFDRSWVQAEIEGPTRNARDDRERAPVEVVLENRSLASGSPASTTVGPLAQSALVDEDDRLPSTPRVFFSAGQRSRFQRRMAASSRSMARPAGRCGLQPRPRKIRHTCDELYDTPHVRSIKSATRGIVHRPMSYPSSSGPRLSSRSITRRSAGESFGLRPARPAFFRPARPDSPSASCHRYTDWRCTPSSRATSACVQPCWRSLAARRRRFSSASKSRLTPAGFPMRQTYINMQQCATILRDHQ